MSNVTRPNLVYILNDDTDVLLGAASTLRQTRALLGDAGATFTEFRTLSPKCTPSRTGQLVGRHYHNVRPRGVTGPPPGGGLNQSTMFEPTALFPMLAAIGYWTSIVGKVHNGQSSFLCSDHNRTDVFTHIGTQCKPCGNYWGAEYVVKDVGDVTTRLETINGSDWSAYSHGQFANRTTAFMRAAVRAKQPFFAHIGTTGPHLPAIPAPWHLEEVSRWTIGAPRAPSFNFDAPSHHPTIAAAPRIDDDKLVYVDALMRDRLGVLLSIDDLVASVVGTLDDLGVLDSSYIFYSSDHGYHLGEWKLPMEKMWPYETDTRIPFWCRGPGIVPGTVVDALAVNIDIAPTLLHLAGAAVPANYDGQSLAPLLIGTRDETAAARRAWRTRTVISFAEGGDQWWGKVSQAALNLSVAEPAAEIHPPLRSESGAEYLFDNPSNQWRMLRVLNATHNVSFVEWDPAFRFDVVNFSAYFDLSADPWQLHNSWPALAPDEQAAWRAELAREFACRGHHGRDTDCS